MASAAIGKTQASRTGTPEMQATVRYYIDDRESGILERRTLNPLMLPVIIALWFAYLILTPVLFARHGSAALLLVPTVGVYLFSWLAHARHWCLHKYFKRINNPRAYKLLSLALFASPDVYALAHRTHHKYVHTPRDIEFFRADWTTNRRARKIQFILECFFGNVVWEFATEAALRKAGLIKGARLKQLAPRLALLLLLAAATARLAPSALSAFALVYGLTVWTAAVVTRHHQWLQHLGIVSDESLAARNLLTRNLDTSTVGGFLFDFINHNDTRDHVLHHISVNGYVQGGSNNLPRAAVTVRVIQYPRILLDHYRSL